MENKSAVEGIPSEVYVALESLKIVSRMMRYEEHSTSNMIQKNVEGEYGSKEVSEHASHARKIRRLAVFEKLLRDNACQVISDYLVNFSGGAGGEVGEDEV